MGTVTVNKVVSARQVLSAFVYAMAIETEARVGFSWSASVEAPDSYEKLQAEFRTSSETGRPLPVSSLYCENVIYETPEHNIAFRFWHDVHHVLLGLDFTSLSELELGLYQLGEMRRFGFKETDLEYRMLEVDLLGQNYLVSMARRFPHRQHEFVLRCLDVGLHQGVLDEARLHK